MSIGPAMDYVWHVMVREGKRIAVYPSGNAGQGISGEMEKGHPAEVKQLFLGRRNHHFGNFQGNIADASVSDHALTHEEPVRHYTAAGQTALRSATDAPARHAKRQER
jgi:hypothetical protein